MDLQNELLQRAVGVRILAVHNDFEALPVDDIHQRIFDQVVSVFVGNCEVPRARITESQNKST